MNGRVMCLSEHEDVRAPLGADGWTGETRKEDTGTARHSRCRRSHERCGEGGDESRRAEQWGSAGGGRAGWMAGAEEGLWMRKWDSEGVWEAMQTREESSSRSEACESTREGEASKSIHGLVIDGYMQ